MALRGLYAITPDWDDTARLLAAVSQSIEGGAVMVQYRNKRADVALRHEQASELLALCQNHDIPLIINDDLRLAAMVDADGLHLGGGDGSLTEARLILGPEKIIGLSCYADLSRALTAEDEGADYVAFGRFYPSRTKPAASPAPLELLTQAQRHLQISVAAIGGIDSANAPDLIRAGADFVAVIAALFEAADIRAAAQGFQALFSEEPA